MIRRKLIIFSLLFLPFFLLADVINLKMPPKSLKAQYVKEALTIAYHSLGHTIVWQDIRGVKELELVQNNKLSAALARADVIEKKFPSLVQIPFPLLNFDLLKVSDRKRCGYCLNEDIRSISYAKSSLISEQYAKSLKSKVHKFPIDNTEKLNNMLLKRRVDSVLIMDFELGENIAKNSSFLIESVDTHFDYHYLSPDFSYLKQPLFDAFKGLEQRGVLASLQLKYDIHPKMKEEAPQSSELNFISGKWIGYTSADGTGVYWQLMKTIFAQEFTVNTSVSIWERAVREFELGNADVLVGAYRTTNIANAIYSSYHLDYEYPLYAFGRNKEAIKRYNNKDKSLIVCSEAGSDAYKQVSFLSARDIIQTSDLQCNKLMENGKIDIFIEYGYNLLESLQKLPKQILIENSPLFLAFHNTPQGHFLKRYFDKKISALALSNELKSIFPDEKTYKQAYIRP